MRLDGSGRGGKGWRKEITHVCMCVYVHAYRNINLYIHVCLCMLTHVLVFCIMFVCAHRHMYLCLCMYMYEFMYAHTCECILYTYMFVCVCTWGLGVYILVYRHTHSSINFVSEQQPKLPFWCWSKSSCWCGSFEWRISQELWGPASPSISELACQDADLSPITREGICGYARSFDRGVLPVLKDIFVFALGFSNYNMKVI